MTQVLLAPLALLAQKAQKAKASKTVRPATNLKPLLPNSSNGNILATQQAVISPEILLLAQGATPAKAFWKELLLASLPQQ